MTVVGKVESLWRYPVKSMRGKKSNNRFWASRVCMVIACTHFMTRRHRRDFPS